MYPQGKDSYGEFQIPALLEAEMRDIKEMSIHQIDGSIVLWWTCHNLLNQAES